jgi:hypothetical protein
LRLNLENYDKVPVIGKVLEKGIMNLQFIIGRVRGIKNGNHGFTV